MGQKLGCSFNPECQLIECGRTCAKSVLCNGTCKRPVKTLPQSFLDNHGVRQDGEGGFVGYHIDRFNEKQSSWRG